MDPSAIRLDKIGGSGIRNIQTQIQNHSVNGGRGDPVEIIISKRSGPFHHIQKYGGGMDTRAKAKLGIWVGELGWVGGAWPLIPNHSVGGSGGQQDMMGWPA